MRLFLNKYCFLRSWDSLFLQNWCLDLFYKDSFFWVCTYLPKATIHPCMEYCCHIWAGAPTCYLDMKNKLQKRVLKIFQYTCYFSWFLGSSSKCDEFNSIDLTFEDVHLKWLDWFLFIVLVGGLLIIKFHNLSRFWDAIKMSLLAVSFHLQLDPWILCLQNFSSSFSCNSISRSCSSASCKVKPNMIRMMKSKISSSLSSNVDWRNLIILQSSLFLWF